jgi:hypothetical protein
LSFGPLDERMKYVLASELDRMAIVRRVRNAGGVIAHDDEQDHFVEVLT